MAGQLVLRDGLAALQTFAGFSAAALREAVARELEVSADSVNVHNVAPEFEGDVLVSVTVSYTVTPG